MKYYFKIILLIIFPGFLFSRANSVAQYYDSSLLIDAAIGLYYKLPSGSYLSREDDAHAKNLGLKKVIQKCYLDDSLQTNKVTYFNKDGTVSKVITKFNADLDSLVLTMRKHNSNHFDYTFSFPFEAIKDSMNFGFAEVIDSLGLHERRYHLKVEMQLIDSITAGSIFVSINDKFMEKRGFVRLLPSYLIDILEGKSYEPTKSMWDSTYENGNLILTNIYTSGGVSLMGKNYYKPNLKGIMKSENFSKNRDGEWMLRQVTSFFYDTLGRLSMTISEPTADKRFKIIDSLNYYPNGSRRSRRIYLPNTQNPVILQDSVFSIEGQLLHTYSYGRDYADNINEIGNRKAEIFYNDTFYTYNKVGSLVQLRRFNNGQLVYFEKYDYEYWDK